jgi:hypothetical protein
LIRRTNLQTSHPPKADETASRTSAGSVALAIISRAEIRTYSRKRIKLFIPRFYSAGMDDGSGKTETCAVTVGHLRISSLGNAR